MVVRYVIPVWCVFSKPCTKLTPHCNHRPGHLKTEHIESRLLLRRHVGNWPHGPALSIRSKLLVAHTKLGQLPLLWVKLCPCKVRNKFLLTFETAPFVCVYPAYYSLPNIHIFENCALLRCYATSIDNSLPIFRNNQYVLTSVSNPRFLPTFTGQVCKFMDP